VEVKKAVPKEESRPGSVGAGQPTSRGTKKVFLGGLSPETTKEDVMAAFTNERVQDVVIMTDKNTEKPRGFGFIIFEDFATAQRVCLKKFYQVKVRGGQRNGEVGGET
jgi:RNA recognition motif-containing protein